MQHLCLFESSTCIVVGAFVAVPAASESGGSGSCVTALRHCSKASGGVACSEEAVDPSGCCLGGSQVICKGGLTRRDLVTIRALHVYR